MSPSTGCCWRTDPSCLPCGSHVGHSCSARHCCGATHRLTLQLQPNAAGWSLSYCLSVTLTFRLQQVATALWLTLQAAAMWQPTAARSILIISALTKLEAPKETARQSYPSSTPPHMLHHYVQQKPKTSKCAAPHPANMCIRLGASFQPIAVGATDAWLQLTVASAVMEGCGAPQWHRHHPCCALGLWIEAASRWTSQPKVRMCTPPCWQAGRHTQTRAPNCILCHQTVWIQATGCQGGLTNQKRGIANLLAVLEVALPKLPAALDAVLVAPTVLLATQPPWAIDANGKRYNLSTLVVAVHPHAALVWFSCCMGRYLVAGCHPRPICHTRPSSTWLGCKRRCKPWETAPLVAHEQSQWWRRHRQACMCGCLGTVTTLMMLCATKAKSYRNTT